MRTLILSFGHTGVTRKAAERLAELIENAEIMDGIPEELPSGFDSYVLGTNVHFGRLNKQFKKCGLTSGVNSSVNDPKSNVNTTPECAVYKRRI